MVWHAFCFIWHQHPHPTRKRRPAMKTTTATATAIVITLLCGTATTAKACGPAGAPGASVPATQAQTSTLNRGCKTTPNGRTNCNAYAGSTVNPGYTHNQYRPGYVSATESRQGLKFWRSVPPGGRIGPFKSPHLGDVGTHQIVIHPDGSISQRFDTDPGRYQTHFNNANDFRKQKPGWKNGQMPYQNSNIDVYCGPNCREH